MAKRSNKSGGDRQAAVNLLEGQADAAEVVGAKAQAYQEALDQVDEQGRQYREAWAEARTWGWSETALRSLPSVRKTGAPPRAPKTRTTVDDQTQSSSSDDRSTTTSQQPS